jgi:hypothetical protein
MPAAGNCFDKIMCIKTFLNGKVFKRRGRKSRNSHGLKEKTNAKEWPWRQKSKNSQAAYRYWTF